MDIYGPPLPPGYVKPMDEDEVKVTETESSTTKVIGPFRPDFLSERRNSENEKCENEILENDSFISISSIGPQLPPHLRNDTNIDYKSENLCGPALAEFGEVDNIKERKAEIEKRAKQMRDKLNNKDIPVKTSEREEWMIVPDTSRRNQLGAISRCLAPSKSSSSASPFKKETHSNRHSEKDEKTSEELKKYNKSRRSESLMDVHAKKLKKKEKEKKSKEKKERKAFDREEMGIRYFTKEQVNSVIDKAKFLNSRFAAGCNKFL